MSKMTRWHFSAPTLWVPVLVWFVGQFLTPNPGEAQQLDPRAVYNKAAPSVVAVIAYDENRQPKTLGSGFAVEEGGVVATNFHVLEGAASVRVKRPSDEEALPIEGVYAVSREQDLALLRVPFDLPPVPLTGARPTVGERVVAIGNPRGLESSLSEGIVSGIRQIEDSFELYQISVPISPGSSGGPVLNARGNVIGVATATIREGQNLNFAVPASLVDRLNENRGELASLSAATSGTSQKAPNWNQSGDEDLVRAIDLSLKAAYATTGRGRELQGSIFNGTQYPIENVHLRLICYRKGV